jgi:DNA invertase Pin-like site-specific DNA recombinase
MKLDSLKMDQVFTDKISGKDKNRPGLKRCMEHLRAGDTLRVHSIDRLARNLRDLETIVKDLVGQGVAVKFEKEGLTFTGDDNPMNTLMLQVMGACAQFELSMIRERQREGIDTIKDLWRSGKTRALPKQGRGVG